MISRSSQLEVLADQLHSMAIYTLRLVRTQDSQSGVGPAQLSALSVLVFGGSLSLNHLASLEQVKPPTMSRLVDALEAAGLARRRRNQQDRRSVMIEATAKGRAILQQGRSRRVKFLAARLARLSRAQQNVITQALDALSRVIAAEHPGAEQSKK